MGEGKVMGLGGLGEPRGREGQWANVGERTGRWGRSPCQDPSLPTVFSPQTPLQVHLDPELNFQKKTPRTTLSGSSSAPHLHGPDGPGGGRQHPHLTGPVP